jgi:hypothetical protein
VISSSLHGSEIQASEYHPVKYGLARWNGGMEVGSGEATLLTEGILAGLLNSRPWGRQSKEIK